MEKNNEEENRYKKYSAAHNDSLKSVHNALKRNTIQIFSYLLKVY